MTWDERRRKSEIIQFLGVDGWATQPEISVCSFIPRQTTTGGETEEL